jgi:phosphatidylserine synthase
VVVFESLTLLVRFLLELCMLGALAYWGFETGDGPAAQALLGVGVPVAAAVVWGMFIAPKARHPVPTAVWIGLQAILFGAAALGLAAVAPAPLAVLFVIAVVLHGAAMAALGLKGAPRP